MAFKEVPNHMLDGPIPGENYTSDTKNYPWHRPPEFTEVDEAIEYLTGVLTDEDGAMAILSMIEAGLDVLSIAHMIIMKGLGSGKWSVDLGILLAGPVAHIIILMCRGAEVEYDIGFTPPGGVATSVFFKEAKKITKKQAKEGAELAKTGGEVLQELAEGGFMQGLGSSGPEGDTMESPDLQEGEDQTEADAPLSEML